MGKIMIFSVALGIGRATVLCPLRRSGHGLSPVPSGERSAPLSPTDVALEMSEFTELCRERPNENSRTKYYDSSHADEQDARHPEEPATGLKKNGQKEKPPAR